MPVAVGSGSYDAVLWVRTPGKQLFGLGRMKERKD